LTVGHFYTGQMAKPIQLVDKFGGLADALDDAKHRMGLAPSTRVTIYELPKLPSSIFGPLGSLLGVREQTSGSVLDLPFVRAVLDGFPASVLISPEAAQARLPYDIHFD